MSAATVLGVLQTIAIILLGLLFLYLRNHVKARATEDAKIDTQLQRLDDIKVTLAATTRTVETIRSEVAQLDWIKRERITLLRQKLEEALDLAYRLRETCGRLQIASVTGTSDELIHELERIYNRLSTVCSLYFSDLKAPAAAVSLASIRMTKHLLELRKRRLAVEGQETATIEQVNSRTGELKQLLAQQASEFPAKYEELVTSVAEFENLAAAQMRKIMPDG